LARAAQLQGTTGAVWHGAASGDRPGEWKEGRQAPGNREEDKENNRLADELSIGTINRELRALRRCLRLAVEWNVIETAPKVSMAGKEPGRERVVAEAELSRYLLCASPLLANVTVILNETGLRPDELHRLGWEDVNFAAGRYGALSVRFGKTDAARRTLPLTARVRCILSARHISAGSPQQGWVFPAPTADGHINHDSLKRLTLRPCACPRFSRS